MYPSDLKDKEWELIRHYFEYTNGYGNRAVHTRRALVNGILYVVKTGCQWRMLPHDFPPWKTVYGYFRRASQLGIWEKVLADLVKLRRIQKGRQEKPSLLIIDAQSVKTSGKGEQRGFDGGKKDKRTQTADCSRYSRTSAPGLRASS
jgi:putative transposase